MSTTPFRFFIRCQPSKSWVGGAAVILVLLGTGCERIPREPAARIYTIQQFMNTVRLSGGDISPDEQTVFYSSNATDVFNLYLQPIEGGTPRQVSFSKDQALQAISFFPDGKHLLLAAEYNGNERAQLQVQAPDGSRSLIYPDSAARVIIVGWGGQPRQLFYSVSTKTRPQEDVYRYDPVTRQSQQVFRNDSTFGVVMVSPNGQYLALYRALSNNASDLYLYDLTTGQLQQLRNQPGQGEQVMEAASFSPDSKRLLYITDQNHEHFYLKEFHLQDGSNRLLYRSDEGSVWYARYHPDGKRIALILNQDAQNQLRFIDTTGREVELPNLPQGEIKPLRFSSSGRFLLFYFTQSESSPNLYVYDFARHESRKLTHTMSAEINTRDLVHPQFVRYPAPDSLPIPALLYVPKRVPAGTRLPAVVSIHGGPGGQSRVGYQPLIQYLVNHGYVVIEPNYRGSSGYGKRFYQMDDRRHGTVDLADCVAAKDFLGTFPYVDTSRVAVMGGSFGGFLALSAMATYPQEFAAGVDLFGITNWVRTLKRMPPWWAAYRRALYQEVGDPVRDSVSLMERSPIRSANRIRKPLLVMQGANDPRVPLEDVQQLVTTVQANGVPVQFLLFQDEGHGFRKRANEIQAYSAILQFLDQYLAPPAPAAVGSPPPNARP